MGNHRHRLPLKPGRGSWAGLSAAQPLSLCQGWGWTPGAPAAVGFGFGNQQGAPETAWDSEQSGPEAGEKAPDPESGPRSSKDENHCRPTVSPFSPWVLKSKVERHMLSSM